ncbi:hypothetical protein ACIU0J_30320 [Pseudomonas aeruginosa]
MSIDWSTAPKDATHWEPDSYHVFGSWMKKEGDSWFWWEGDVGRWSPSLFISEQRMGTFEARPQESWNGQGLPPVGTVCEVLWNESRLEYLKAKVFGVNEHGQPIFRFEEGPKKFEYQADPLRTASGTQVFRPVRTLEQVAAAERWAAIQQMLAFADVKYGAGELMSPKEYVETAVSALYDAGYRRQEEGK